MPSIASFEHPEGIHPSFETVYFAATKLYQSLNAYTQEEDTRAVNHSAVEERLYVLNLAVENEALTSGKTPKQILDDIRQDHPEFDLVLNAQQQIRVASAKDQKALSFESKPHFA